MRNPPQHQDDGNVIHRELPGKGVLRVISDLHLGHPGSLFAEVDELFPLLEGAASLILNGDTTEECSRALRSGSNTQFDALMGEAERRGIEVLRLRGNHDPIPGLAAAVRFFKGRILVTHGDVCFSYGSPWSRWLPHCKDRLDRVYAEFEQRGIRTLSDRLDLALAWGACFHPPVRKRASRLVGMTVNFAQAFWPPSTAWRLFSTRLSVLRWSEDFIEQFAPEAQVLIYGHIHKAGAWKRKSGKWLVNLGAFQTFGGRAVCDLDNEGITLRKVVRRDGRFVVGKVRQRITWQSLGIDPLRD